MSSAPAALPPDRPLPRAPRAPLLALLFAAAVALACVGLRDGVGPHDEGLVLAAADRVAHGQLPYRDFWWNYGPGEPLLLGGLVKLVGPSLLVWRIARALAGGLVAVVAACLAAALGASERWALAAGATAGSALAWPLTPGPNAFALVPAFAAVLLALRGRPTGAGLAVGLTAFLRPELGAAAALSALLTRRTGGWTSSPGEFVHPRAGRIVGVGVGCTVVLVGPFAALAPGDWASDTLGFYGVQGLQRLPLDLSPPGDPNKAFEVLFPVLLLAATAVWALLGRARPLALVPLALAGLAYLIGRPDEFHLVLLAAVLGPALAVAAPRAPRGARAGLALALLVVLAGGVERQAGRLRHPDRLAAVPGPVGDGVRTTPPDAAALRVLLPRLRRSGRSLVVLPPRLDRVRVGDPLLNVEARRISPTRYDVMQPGVVTTASVQRELRDDIARAQPVVVRWNAAAAVEREDDGSGREHGSRLLDTWLATHYRPWFRAGVYAAYLPRR